MLELFFNEVAGLRLSTALKNDSSTVEQLFYRTPVDWKVSSKSTNVRDLLQ